jgi:hypothetical protein
MHPGGAGLVGGAEALAIVLPLEPRIPAALGERGPKSAAQVDEGFLHRGLGDVVEASHSACSSERTNISPAACRYVFCIAGTKFRTTSSGTSSGDIDFPTRPSLLLMRPTVGGSSSWPSVSSFSSRLVLWLRHARRPRL